MENSILDGKCHCVVDVFDGEETIRYIDGIMRWWYK